MSLPSAKVTDSSAYRTLSPVAQASQRLASPIPSLRPHGLADLRPHATARHTQALAGCREAKLAQQSGPSRRVTCHHCLFSEPLLLPRSSVGPALLGGKGAKR